MRGMSDWSVGLFFRTFVRGGGGGVPCVELSVHPRPVEHSGYSSRHLEEAFWASTNRCARFRKTYSDAGKIAFDLWVWSTRLTEPYELAQCRHDTSVKYTTVHSQNAPADRQKLTTGRSASHQCCRRDSRRHELAGRCHWRWHCCSFSVTSVFDPLAVPRE